MDFNSLKKNYINHLETNLLPFWERAIDTEDGGVFTCFTNDGSKLVSDKKYIWSQGRFLWLCCNLQKLKEQGVIQLSERWNEAMDKTYGFLTQNALMENNHVVFAVKKDGGKIKGHMDTSIFADCFYVLGCNAYAFYKRDKNVFDNTLIIYNTIKQRVENDEFSSEPYPIPAGYSSHSIPMILLNVAQELYETALSLNHMSKDDLLTDVRMFLDQIANKFTDNNRIIEMYSSSSNQEGALLERHLNPGHTIESAWFMLHGINQLKPEGRKEYLSYLSTVSNNALTLGWDRQHGGLLRFVDKEGGIPKGEEIQTPYESLIKDTWDTKLWWPHAEALYTTLLLFYETKNQYWLEWYQKVADYVFNTFPNPNENIGEWIQIRNREGYPLKKVVALPVKDPFHIIRSYTLIIKLLEGEDNHAFRYE